MSHHTSPLHRITEAIEHANTNTTKLTHKALSIPGLTSTKIKILLNELVQHPNTKYLEIGVLHGCTFYPALYGNHPQYAQAIDNFTEFGGTEKTFHENMADIQTPYHLINSDCFNLTQPLPTKFNTYFYDAAHSTQAQKQALTYYYEHLEDEFIYICDDWNWPTVQEGTIAGLKETNLQIKHQWELISNQPQDSTNWWNGLLILTLKK